MGLLVVLFFWNIGVGSVEMSFFDFLGVLTKHQPDSTLYQIVWKIRLPRIIAAVLLGGALSVSGFLLQSFFQNPIAGPYVLGISSGAKLVVALTMIFLLEKGIMVSSLGMVVAAFAGSLLAMGFVLLISFRVSNMSLLVVCGILIVYICSAITDFCVTFADDSNIVNLHNWSMGSFSGMSWEHIRIMVIIVGITVVITFGLAKPISAYQMGESYARNMGVNVKALRIALILLSSLLSACVTAFAGPISFVGIAVPHLIKLATHTAKPIILIPGCFLGGAVITLFCDGIARTVSAHYLSSTIHHIRCFRNIAAITTGTKNTAVTELILISVGANTVRAIPSQNSVITAPPRKHPGIRIIGFAGGNCGNVAKAADVMNRGRQIMCRQKAKTDKDAKVGRKLL